MTSQTRGMNIGCGGILLLIGVVIFVFGLLEARKLTRDGQYPTTMGTIVEARADMIGRRIEEPAIFVRLSYTVAGQSYGITDWLTGVGSYADAQQAAPSYLGATRRVWYDPAQPSVASLQPMGLTGVLAAFGGAGLLLTVGGLSVGSAFRGGRRSARPAGRPTVPAPLDAAVKANPRDPQAYLKRGITYHQQKFYDEAYRDYSRAIQCAPKEAQYYRYRAAVLRDMGKHRDSLADFSSAIRLNPRSSDYYFRRAQVYDLVKMNAEALADFSKAIELVPHQGLYYLERGLTYQHLRRLAEALADYDSAIACADEDAPLAHRQRAMIYEEQGKNAAAIRDYTAYIQSGAARQRGDLTEIQRRVQKLEAKR